MGIIATNTVLPKAGISRFSIPEALELMKEQTGLKREQIKLNKMNEINNNNETANGTKPVLGEGFDYVITFGKYKGKTLVQILDESPSYIIWLSENDVVKIPDDLLIMACHDTMSPDFEDLHSDWGCLD